MYQLVLHFISLIQKFYSISTVSINFLPVEYCIWCSFWKQSLIKPLENWSETTLIRMLFELVGMTWNSTFNSVNYIEIISGFWSLGYSCVRSGFSLFLVSRENFHLTISSFFVYSLLKYIWGICLSG